MSMISFKSTEQTYILFKKKLKKKTSKTVKNMCMYQKSYVFHINKQEKFLMDKTCLLLFLTLYTILHIYLYISIKSTLNVKKKHHEKKVVNYKKIECSIFSDRITITSEMDIKFVFIVTFF